MSCYTMSWMVGRTLVQALYPEQLAKYAREVAQRRAALFNYIVLLRATPVRQAPWPACLLVHVFEWLERRDSALYNLGSV